MIAEKITYKQTGIEWLPKVPEHWDVVRLKNVCQVINGATPSSDIEKYWNGNIHWVTPAEFGDETYINDSVRKITEEGLNSCATSLVPKGSIIISTRAPIGSLAITNIELCTNQGCRAIIADKINNYFVYYFLSIQTASLNAFGNGTTFKELSGGTLKNYYLPLPPKEEQDEIVQHIKAQEEKINLFIQKKQRFIELLKEQRQTIIKHKLSNSDDTWKRRKISHSFKIIGSGTTPESSNSDFYNGGEIYWINTGDLNDGYLESCEKKITQLAFDKFSTLKIYPKGTLLIALYGATIGKVAIMNIEGCTNQACCAMYGSETFYTEFLFCWFIANRDLLIQMSYGGGQPNISQEIIRQLRILCPSVEQQKQIVQHIQTETKTIDTAIAKAEKEIELIKEYKEAMISEAVSGQNRIKKD